MLCPSPSGPCRVAQGLPVSGCADSLYACSCLSVSVLAEWALFAESHTEPDLPLPQPTSPSIYRLLRQCTVCRRTHKNLNRNRHQRCLSPFDQKYRGNAESGVSGDRHVQASVGSQRGASSASAGFLAKLLLAWVPRQRRLRDFSPSFTV